MDYADKWWRVATELPFFKEIYQHYYEQIINSANMMKLNCQNLNNELKAEKLFQGFVEKKQLQKYVTARIDFKNYGLNNNDVVVTEFSDIDAKIQKPAWFKNEKGQGCVTESSKGSMALEMKCIGDGELKIFLRGMDCRDNNNNRIPIWINYTSLFVNDQCIFKESKLVWHDKPFVYKLNVTDAVLISVLYGL